MEYAGPGLRMWAEPEKAHAALRAAEDTAPQESLPAQPSPPLARDLATLAPASIRRDAEQFASRIGVVRCHRAAVS